MKPVVARVVGRLARRGLSFCAVLIMKLVPEL